MLKKTGSQQDWLLYGAYAGDIGWDSRRANLLNSRIDTAELATAADRRCVVLTLQMSGAVPGFPREALAVSSKARRRLFSLIKHDVILSLARGVDGIQVWSLWPRREDFDTYNWLLSAYSSALSVVDDHSAFLIAGFDYSVFKVSNETAAFRHHPPESFAANWPTVRVGFAIAKDSSAILIVNSSATASDVLVAPSSADAEAALEDWVEVNDPDILESRRDDGVWIRVPAFHSSIIELE